MGQISGNDSRHVTAAATDTDRSRGFLLAIHNPDFSDSLLK